MRPTDDKPIPDHPVRDHLIAVAWGAAEATFFFIVPDVWLTRLAIHSPKRAATASLSALGGALVGGYLTYRWGRGNDPETTKEALRRVPAISGAMIERSEDEMRRFGVRAVVAGPPRGVPYKIYARIAGMENASLGAFLAWSVPARLPRFLLVSGLTGLAARQAHHRMGDETTRRLSPWVHLVGWTLFYTWYLRTVGREDDAPTSE